METTLKRRRGFYLSEKTKAIIVDVICYLFIGLFVYTAASKFQTMESFINVLGSSPLIGTYNVFIGWVIPTLEILLSILLIIPVSKKLGLYGSLLLMIIFTAYLIYMIFSGSNLPCHCGGAISAMSWKQHIWFNLGFILLVVVGLKLYKK